MLRTLILLALIGCEPYRLPASDPCSLENPNHLAFVLECDAEIAKCQRNPDGTPLSDCPALVRCETALHTGCG
jgi:hypothetical protein